MLELTVVLVLASVMMSIAAITFGAYQTRTAARRAAQIFSRDLTLARSSALRTREPVIVRFYESSRWYSVATRSGQTLVRRRYGGGGDFTLSGLDLEISGDSVVFTGRGVVDLSGVVGLGKASFTSGATTYESAFNATGASRIAER